MKVIDDESADEWTRHGGKAEHHADNSVIPPPLLGRREVARGRYAGHQDHAPTDPLDGAKENELVHALAQRDRERAEHQRGDAEQKEQSAPIQVAELPRDGHGGR